MSMLITVPGLVAIGGLLLYGLLDGKAAEVGRLAFFAGLLAVLLRIGGRL